MVIIRSNHITLNSTLPGISHGTAIQKGGVFALYVNYRIEWTLTKSKQVVVENIFECVTVELNMRNMINVIVSCMCITTNAGSESLEKYS